MTSWKYFCLLFLFTYLVVSVTRCTVSHFTQCTYRVGLDSLETRAVVAWFIAGIAQHVRRNGTLIALSACENLKSFGICRTPFCFLRPFYPLRTPKYFLFISLDNDQLDAHLLYFILQYVYYNPLHVSSIICSSSGGWIVLMQHLVSSSQSVAVRRTGWERTAEQFSLNLCTGRPLTEGTIPDVASIQFNLLMMSI